MKEPTFEKKKNKKLHFRNVHFSSGKKQIRENTYLKRQTFGVDSLGVYNDFRSFTLSCFFDPDNGGAN